MTKLFDSEEYFEEMLRLEEEYKKEVRVPIVADYNEEELWALFEEQHNYYDMELMNNNVNKEEDSMLIDFKDIPF
jgi:hypothetical protein